MQSIEFIPEGRSKLVRIWHGTIADLSPRYPGKSVRWRPAGSQAAWRTAPPCRSLPPVGSAAAIRLSEANANHIRAAKDELNRQRKNRPQSVADARQLEGCPMVVPAKTTHQRPSKRARRANDAASVAA